MSHLPLGNSGKGEISAVLRRADNQPPNLELGDGCRLRYLATGAGTDGEVGLYFCEFLGPPSGADPHYHTAISEWFWIQTGTVQLYNGCEWVEGMPGDFLFVPKGGIHGFRNQSGEPATMLLGFVPGAPREDFFEGLAALAGGNWRPGAEELGEFMRRHDNHLLRPPVS